MGALTFKPLAFGFRPWELTATRVADHLGARLAGLVFHLRGGHPVRITAPAAWLDDRTRFAADGFRRQRLISPLAAGYPVTWPAALVIWLTYLVRGGRFTFKLDPFSATYFFWFARLYSVHADGRGRAVPVGVDYPGQVEIYHGSHGLAFGPVRAGLALPQLTPYEVDGVVSSPGVPELAFLAAGQLLIRPFSFTVDKLTTGWDDRPRQTRVGLFQVSPFQVLLTEW